MRCFGAPMGNNYRRAKRSFEVQIYAVGTSKACLTAFLITKKTGVRMNARLYKETESNRLPFENQYPSQQVNSAV